jgi:hypothetical protein
MSLRIEQSVNIARPLSVEMEVQMASMVVRFYIITKDSYLEFPTVGKVDALYVDSTENAMYRWDDVKLKYYCIGRDYKEIEFINGGTLG